MFSTKRTQCTDRIDALESKVEALRLDLAETRGRLASVPGAVQILGWIVAIGVAVVGLAFAVSRVM